MRRLEGAHRRPRENVGTIYASPTGMVMLTERGIPASHPAPPPKVTGARRAVDYCKSVGADIVKLAVQFCVAHPGIATNLVGNTNPATIRKNVAYVDEPIDFELMARVLDLLKPIHNHNFTRGLPENRDPLIA